MTCKFRWFAPLFLFYALWFPLPPHSSSFRYPAGWHNLYNHSQIGPLEIIVLTSSEGEDKRARMIDLLKKKKKVAVCDATARQWSRECCNFELLLALRFARGCRIAMSFNWLLKTPFACSPCPALHTHTERHTHTCQCQWLYMSVHFWNMLMKSYLDKRSALQGLLNSNGCELAWLNATVAFLVLPKGTGALAKQRLCCWCWLTQPKGTAAPAKSAVA